MQALNIFQSLLLIQDKHADYFNRHHNNIVNLLRIEWQQPLKVALKDEDIPGELKKDIEILILPFDKKYCDFAVHTI